MVPHLRAQRHLRGGSPPRRRSAIRLSLQSEPARRFLHYKMFNESGYAELRCETRHVMRRVPARQNRRLPMPLSIPECIQLHLLKRKKGMKTSSGLLSPSGRSAIC